MEHDTPLLKLIHDVDAKCSTLNKTAVLLKDASPDKRKEYLRQMREQAKSLVEILHETL